MPFTRPFQDTVIERAKADPLFRAGRLTEAAECFLNGELGAAKIMLRNYVDASIGLQTLASKINKTSQSLARILSVKGQPRAEDLSLLISALQRHEGIQLQVKNAG